MFSYQSQSLPSVNGKRCIQFVFWESGESDGWENSIDQISIDSLVFRIVECKTPFHLRCKDESLTGMSLTMPASSFQMNSNDKTRTEPRGNFEIVCISMVAMATNGCCHDSPGQTGIPSFDEVGY